MPYVITQGCCNDASCTTACPVDCIHPTPQEAGFGDAEMLCIDPDRMSRCRRALCRLTTFAASSPMTGAGQRELSDLIRESQPQRVDVDGWNAIDSAERERGAAEGKVRAKVVDIREMLAIADHGR